MTWLPALVLLLPQAPPSSTPAATPPPAVRPVDEAGIDWQRSLDDALALQRATGKPLLICVNADGETFCERFANTTYRDPEFVARTRGYVCVVASPDRHTETDYDGLGRRVECPRFPGVTCSEHANIEPELYARWFGGQRYAPRHVAVDANGKVLFDRFLDGSMQTAIDAIAQHAGDRARPDLPDDLGALLARRDARGRRAAEARYRDADRDGRLALLRRCGELDGAPFDVLRMGLRDDDDAVFAAAARSLAAIAAPAAVIDLQDAVARCDDADLEQALLAAAERVAANDAAAAAYLTGRRAVDTGLAETAHSPHVHRERCFGTGAGRDRAAVEADLDEVDGLVKKAPRDAALRLRQATATLELAMLQAAEGGATVSLLFEDARRAAKRIQAKDFAWGKQAIEAVAQWQLGRGPQAVLAAREALDRAVQDALADHPWLGAELLRSFARAQAAAAYAAVEADPNAVAAEPVRDAAFAFAALVSQPLATARDAIDGARLLAFFGGRRAAQDLLRQALRRWPWDRDLHDAFRRRITADRGAERLRREYADFVADVTDADGDVATAEWFAGYAAIVAAELHVRDQRPQQARAAYTDCVDRFAESVAANADYADTADHFATLALAGRALQRHLDGDAAGAVADLLAARALRPASMTAQDGLERTPEGIQRRVARELQARGEAELAARLQ
ncbi:MAG: hypothetical protein AB7O97_08030 [Planctomycetota bacterium]